MLKTFSKIEYADAFAQVLYLDLGMRRKHAQYRWIN